MSAVVRSRELHAILQLSEQPREAALLIRGERGCGKSELLGEAEARLAPRGLLVRANRAESVWALSGLSAVCAALNDPRLGSYFEELRHSPPNDLEPFSVAAELVSLLRSLQLPRTVLLIDDVDDLDDASREVVSFLARRLAGTGLSLVMSLSPETFDDEFAGLNVVALNRFRREEAIAFSRSCADIAPAVLEIVCHDAEGRPDALADQLAELEHAQLIGDAALVLPLHGSERVGARLAAAAARLSEEQRVLLDELAMAPVTPVVALTAGRPGMRDDLADLEASDFIAEDGRFAQIADAQLRSYLYWRHDTKSRRERHEKLAARTADADHRLALWHSSFVNPDVVRAADLLRAAASLVESGAAGAAVELAERALIVRREGERFGALLADLAGKLLQHGSVAFATRYVRLAGREHPDTDLTLRLAELRLRLDFAADERIVPEAALTLARRHADEAPASVCAYLTLVAVLHAQRWELDASRHVLTEGQKIGGEGEIRGRRQLATLIGDAVEGRPRRALDHYREATRDGLASIPPSRLTLLGNALSLGERYDEARAAFATLLRAEGELTPHWETVGRLYLIDNEIRSGNDARALQAVEELESRELSPQFFPAHRLVLLVWYFQSIDDPGKAGPLLEHAERPDFVDRYPAMLARLRANLGAFALVHGDSDEALHHLTQLEFVAERFGNPSLLRYEADLIEAFSRRGQTTAAVAAYRALQERAARHPSRWATLALARSKGFVTTGEASVGAFRQALRYCSSDDSRYERARTLLGLAYRLGEVGQQRESHESYLAAAALFTTLGARAWARSARDTASGVHRLAPVSSDENRMLRMLTSDERAVVERVLLGQRNREIAAELFVSVRTVEIRLTRTYRKLGVRSRSHLASLFAPALSGAEQGAG